MTTEVAAASPAQEEPRKTALQKKIDRWGWINLIRAVCGGMVIKVALGIFIYHRLWGWAAATVAILIYYALCWVVINAAHWGSVEVAGYRLTTVVKEGLRFRLLGIMKIREFSGELTPLPVKGKGNLRDGTEVEFSGTVDIVRDHKVKTARGAPRYPEVHRHIESGTFSNRVAKVIQMLLSYCNNEELQQHDEAVQLSLACMIMMKTPPHVAAAWPDDQVIIGYRTYKAQCTALRDAEVAHNTRGELEEQYSVKVIGLGVSFTTSKEGAKEELLILKVKKFVQGHDQLTAGGRMDNETARRTLLKLDGGTRGVEVEVVGGQDPHGLVAAAATNNMLQQQPAAGGGTT